MIPGISVPVNQYLDGVQPTGRRAGRRIVRDQGVVRRSKKQARNPKNERFSLPGRLLRSESGRPLDPYPKWTKGKAYCSDRAHKKWLQKQANDELAYLAPPSGVFFWFAGCKTLSDPDMYNASILLFGPPLGEPMPWHFVRTPEERAEKRAKDERSFDAMIELLDNMEPDTSSWRDMRRSSKNLLGVMIFEDEFDRRWRERDKGYLWPDPSSEPDEFMTSGPDRPGFERDKKSGLDIGFQVFKIDTKPEKLPPRYVVPVERALAGINIFGRERQRELKIEVTE